MPNIRWYLEKWVNMKEVMNIDELNDVKLNNNSNLIIGK